jgi:hypothetical protein
VLNLREKCCEKGTYAKNQVRNAQTSHIHVRVQESGVISIVPSSRPCFRAWHGALTALTEISHRASPASPPFSPAVSTVFLFKVPHLAVPRNSLHFTPNTLRLHFRSRFTKHSLFFQNSAHAHLSHGTRFGHINHSAKHITPHARHLTLLNNLITLPKTIHTTPSKCSHALLSAPP